MSDSTAASREYNVRIPSLFEIFFGKLANWFRQLAKWRKQGLLRRALEAARRRRVMRMEQLEPRLLLSADLAHGALDADLRLQAVDDGDATHLSLLDSNSSEVDSIILDQAADDVALDVQRAETARIDLDALLQPDGADESHIVAVDPATAVAEAPVVAESHDIAVTVQSSSEVIFGA